MCLKMASAKFHPFCTYIFKPVLAELTQQMQEPEQREPRRPLEHFLHILDVHHAEDEDELVEHKVPEAVLHVLKIQQVAWWFNSLWPSNTVW